MPLRASQRRILIAVATVAAIVAGGFLVVTAVAGYASYAMIPKSPLEKTRRRLKNDVNQLKEHIA